MDTLAPPGKGNGALLQAPISKKLRLPQYKSARGFTQACAHPVTVTERLPKSHLHFARLTCALCGYLLRWLPKPETVVRQQLNGFRLAKLAMVPGLTNWERQFVADVSKRRKLSPKQLAIAERLVRQYLETAP
jgi:hypothetical protein